MVGKKEKEKKFPFIFFNFFPKKKTLKNFFFFFN